MPNRGLFFLRNCMNAPQNLRIRYALNLSRKCPRPARTSVLIWQHCVPEFDIARYSPAAFLACMEK
ncbi:Uncharacterised protein [Bordetella pertussis]|nr:Uncharacterised protein [Bordetella pertussis]